MRVCRWSAKLSTLRGKWRSLRATVDREDFGLGWNQRLEANRVLVGHGVDIELELVRAAEGDA